MGSASAPANGPTARKDEAQTKRKPEFRDLGLALHREQEAILQEVRNEGSSGSAARTTTAIMCRFYGVRAPFQGRRCTRHQAHRRHDGPQADVGHDEGAGR